MTEIPRKADRGLIERRFFDTDNWEAEDNRDVQGVYDRWIEAAILSHSGAPSPKKKRDAAERENA